MKGMTMKNNNDLKSLKSSKRVCLSALFPEDVKSFVANANQSELAESHRLFKAGDARATFIQALISALNSEESHKDMLRFRSPLRKPN